MPLGPKMAQSRGHMVYIGLKGKHEKIFLSETTRPLICSITLWTLFQVYSSYAPWAKNVHPNIKFTYSEYGHAAYQIKGNAAYYNILANILLLHLPLTRGLGSKGQFVSFSESQSNS